MNNTSDIESTENIDLTVCDREPIHRLGHIQQFGCFIALNVDWIVAFCSANTQDYFNTDPENFIGQPVRQWLDSQLIHDLRSAYQSAIITGRNERLFNRKIDATGQPVDISVHFNGVYIVVEFEQIPASRRSEDSFVRALISQFYRARTAQELLEDMAQQLRFVTGYDRVMIYQLLPDQAGEVVAEAATSELESFLGLRFPASDIPKQARTMYTKNLLRVINDVHANPVPILPIGEGQSGRLDLTYSTLRAVSPVHIQYLKNMGVGASLSVSLIVDDNLWGLIAFHHGSARVPSYAMRTDLELFAEVLALELSARLSREREAAAKQVRDTHDKVISTISRQGSLREVLVAQLATLKNLIRCDGIAAVVDGHAQGEGPCLTGAPLQQLLGYLEQQDTQQVFHTDCLTDLLPDYDINQHHVAGLLAIPLSHATTDYLIFYRNAQTQTVTWAGNPDKLLQPAAAANHTGEATANALMPRTSFAAWQETYHERAEPWASSDLRSAESLRVTLLELVIHNFQERDQFQQKASRTHEVLISELNHRVRNILNLVNAIITQTGQQGRTVAEYADTLSQRIRALASAHDQLTTARWEAVSFQQLLDNEIQAYAAHNNSIHLGGPAVLISPEAATPMVLVLHELLTNAAKYGALAASQPGVLRVDWRYDNDNNLQLTWNEQAGGVIAGPRRNGFGMTLIQRIIPHELGGDVKVDFEPGGLQVSLKIPARFITSAPDEMKKVAPAAPSLAGSTTGLPDNVLIIEDNLIIAMDIQKKLQANGVKEAGIAGSLKAAEAYLNHAKPDMIVSDVHLGNDTTLRFLEAAIATKIPCIIISGYGEDVQKPATLNHVPVLTKPVTDKLLLQTLRNQWVADAVK
ncbi:GAF domain-containing protein [Salinimonas marina]|uniref:histidine kinase n=1 Tax=Salinimonas marina TaxID=2785918 RepID=A0A7S9HBW8_9ALTE|nr:HWE histidine kinase domain-containing protein [Salinimonas marina]QPG04535.1 GAF domain-containing protein [Salinimonas marina]